MIRRPLCVTSTDTLVPYTTLFRSADSRWDRSRTCKENKSAPVLDSPCGLARRQGARKPGTERTTGKARELGWLRQARQKARRRRRADHHPKIWAPPAPQHGDQQLRDATPPPSDGSEGRRIRGQERTNTIPN